MCAARRFLWQHKAAPITPQSEETSWLEAIRKHHDDSMVPASTLQLMEGHLGCSYLFPKNQDWLLRNLTTRETVSFEQVSILTSQDAKRGKVNSLRFDDVLLMRTCWTSIPSHCEEGLNVHRGAWAGHRFDIVTAKIHNMDETVEHWCDVTEAVVGETEVLRRKLGQTGYDRAMDEDDESN